MPLLRTNGVGNATKEFVERARSIVRLEIELALLEIKTKLTRIGVGIGLAAGAAVLAVYAVGFLFAAIAAAIALALPLWASLLIVSVTLFGITAVLGLLGIRSIKAGAPPMPEEAIEEAKLTTRGGRRWPLGRPTQVKHDLASERKGLEHAATTLRTESGNVAKKVGLAAAAVGGRRDHRQGRCTRFPAGRAGEETSVRDFPFPAKTEPAPTSPYRLSLGSWGSALKSTVKEFLADDCLGLAQQIAFSSLLAFFPSVILVVGLLGLLGSGAYDSLIHLLGSVAPKGVLDAIDLAKQSSADNHAGSAIALAIGVVGALWAASGATASIVKAVNRASDLEESRPFWKVRLLALGARRCSPASSPRFVFVLIVFGGPLGDAVAKRADLGSEFTVLWDILRWPIAFAGILALLRDRLLARPEPDAAELEVADAGLDPRRRPLARALGPVRAVHQLLELVRPHVRLARRRDHPPALAELLGGRAADRRGAERGAGAARERPG